MYEPAARCFNESFCKTLFHAIWLLFTCDKGSDEPAQMCILNTAFSTQRDTCNLTHGATISASKDSDNS